jgi:seryl-tRNA synthetase
MSSTDADTRMISNSWNSLRALLAKWLVVPCLAVSYVGMAKVYQSDEETRCFNEFIRLSAKVNDENKPKLKHPENWNPLMDSSTEWDQGWIQKLAKFNTNLAKANADESRIGIVSRKAILDSLVDISNETTLLKEIKDVRDELNIISMILDDQREALKRYLDMIPEAQKELSVTRDKAGLWIIKPWTTDLRRIEASIRDIKRLGEHAERVHDAVSISSIFIQCYG